MRGTREPILGSTRSQTRTLRLRSPFKSPMKEHADLNLDNWILEFCFMSALTSDLEDANTFNEASDNQDPKIRNLWREAIKKELNSVESKKVWTEKQKNGFTMNKRLVGCKWIFKV